MNLTKSSNPAFSERLYSGASATAGSGVMTVQGTVNKIFLMFLLVLAGSVYTWKLLSDGNMSALNTYMIVGGIGGFILALVTIFRPKSAPFTAPVYALLEGLLIGGLSAIFNAKFPGIVMNAVALTFGTLFTLLFAYKTGMIKVTQKFRTGVLLATGGIFFAYLLNFILGLFGINLGFIHGGGTISIIISLVIVVVAALNLVLDFDFIERGAASGAPKYFEWYGAFGLMVTLIWLYLELLRLLAMLANRN